MRKLFLTTSLLLLGFRFLFPAQLQAACVEGEWSFRTDVKGEKWQGDYGACGGGRYRCHSYCWDRWSLQCVGGQWVDKWVAASGCSKDTVCRATEGAWGRSCDCCTTPTHKECGLAAKKCVTVSGTGSDTCAKDSDCVPPATHKVCSSEMKCVDAPGSGVNGCTLDVDCQCRCRWVDKDCGGGGACAASERFRVWECTESGANANCPSPDGSACYYDSRCERAVPQVAAWFQTARGDVVAAGGLAVNIPNAGDAAPFSPAFNIAGYKGAYFSVGQPVGVVFTGKNTDVSFGDKGGTVSTKGWLAKDYPLSTTLADYNYSSFLIKWKPQIIVSGGILTGGKISGSSFAGKVVLVQGSLTVEDDDNLDQAAALILVEGTLDFRNDFYPPDSAILFISQGAVSVDPTVKNIRAAVLTDAQIGMGAANPKPADGLLLEGMYLANSGVGNLIIQRERLDNKAPAVMFAYSPEIIVKLTESFGRSRVLSWREVIGGKK